MGAGDAAGLMQTWPHRVRATSKSQAADCFPTIRIMRPHVKRPALKNFRRIVVKVGSSLLIDSDAGEVRAAWLAALAADIAKLHGEGRDILVVSSGSIALGRSRLKLPRGPLKLEESQAAAAVGQIALARIWSEVLGASRHRRRADPGDAAGHRGAPPLSQCALDHRQAAGMARGAGDQRERHGRDQRNPLRRQRSPRRARRHHGERRPADPAVRHRRPLRRAARRQSQRQTDSDRRIRHLRDRGDGGRGRIRTVARRHADQDRGGEDRDHRRHAYADRVRQDRASAAGDRRRRPLHLVPDAGQSRHRAQTLDRGLAGAEGHADHRCRRGQPRCAPARACCRPA